MYSSLETSEPVFLQHANATWWILPPSGCFRIINPEHSDFAFHLTISKCFVKLWWLLLSFYFCFHFPCGNICETLYLQRSKGKVAYSSWKLEVFLVQDIILNSLLQEVAISPNFFLFFPLLLLLCKGSFFREVFQKEEKEGNGHFNILNQTKKASTVVNTSEDYNLSI